MDLITKRLRFELLGEDTEPEEVLAVFNSNPGWVAASDNFAGKTAWDRADAEMHLWKESLRESSVSFGIRWSQSGELIGLGGFLDPHPERGVPMIGLLLMSADWQNKGVGTEAVEAIEAWLRQRGWKQLLVTVLQACPEVRSFWEGRGFHVIEHTQDQDKRSVWVLDKHLV